MATRGWGGSIALAVGVAAGASAAQLGLGYGLGIIAWTAATDRAGESTWLASLAWATWVAATATVLGAISADRLSAAEAGGTPPTRRSTVDETRPGALATTAWRLVIALTAGIGALLTVPLVAIPARAAHRPDTFAPQTIAGGYAIVGVAVGVLIAVAALSARAIAVNAVATTGWLWALAMASVIDGAAAGQGLSTAQLAVWRFGSADFLRDTISLPGAALMMGIALAIGALSAWPAGRRGANRVGVAISGAFGPLVVAAAYFLAAPKLTGVRADEQLSAYLIAPYAVMAGLAGSVLVTAVITQREQRAAAVGSLSALPIPAQATTSTVESAVESTVDSADRTEQLPTAGKAPLWPGEDQI
jgi:hypothetical protein